MQIQLSRGVKVYNDKKKIFVHIGMPKTGTTALQNFFYRNASILKERGINYPEFFTPEIGNATSLVGPLIQNGPKLECPSYTSDMLEKYLSKQKKHILLSSEWFICLDVVILKKFKEIFYKHGYEPIIICYIRRRDKELQSRYCQAFKYRKIDCKCEELVIHQNYVNTLNKFSSVFPKENIMVRCHEKQQFIGGNIFSDFLNVLNIHDIGNFNLPTKKINASPPKHFVNFFRICNKFFDVSDDFRSVLIRIAEELGADLKDDEVSWLSPADRVAILKGYEFDDKRIASEFLNRKNGVLFQEEWPEPNDAWEDPYDITGEDAIKSLLPIIVHQHKEINELKKRIK